MRTEATTAEAKWWRKFRSVLRDMPPSMEVIVNAYGCATAAERGAVREALDQGDDAGAATTFNIGTIDKTGLVDGGGGL